MSSLGFVGTTAVHSPASGLSGTLNNKQPDIFSSKVGLLWNNKELQFRTCGLMVNHMQIQRNKEEDHSFMDFRGAVINKESIGGH